MTTRFNAAIKAEWVAALRSGKYAQGRHRLHNYCDDSFCCLGVLQALHPEFMTKGAGKCEYLDVGLCGIDFQVQETLACLNDEGFSFDKIADIIEETLPCTT